MSFFQALRTLEHQYGIRYEGVEVAADLAQELGSYSHTPQMSAQQRLRSCEKRLRGLKEHFSMSLYADLAFVLDRAHYLVSNKKEDAAKKTLTVWSGKITQLLNEEQSCSDFSKPPLDTSSIPG
tara:strand:- start:6142 stop:6513 length:372 start_codon:yes stop_codon:yes gene_type:complete